MLLITFLISLLSVSLSQILAIDFGTQYIKAAIVHSGAGKAFQIVENHKSERKFQNALGFFNDERLYQSNALSKRSRIPQNCFVYTKLLIDFVDNNEQLDNIKKDQLLEFINHEKNQLLGKFILSGFPDQTKQINFLEVLGMIFKYIKLQTEKFIKTSVKDCVIALPSHWNIHKRNFIISAAQVAQLYVISLISQNTAAAINYQLNQKSSNSTEVVMFFNLGANQLQISVVQFKPISYQKSVKPVESIFVIGQYAQSYVGGLKLDSVVAKYFAGKFKQKHHKDVSPRGYIKLLVESSKIKQILSANREASIFVEGLDGVDYIEKITRAKFQELALPTLQLLVKPIKGFLFDNDLRPSDIKIVELIGGSVRIPKLQSMIADAIGQQATVGTHINGDQAMALGSAFFAANSSKKFKVQGMHLYDGFNFQIRLVASNLEKTSEDSEHFFLKNVTVFKKKSRFGITKEVNFRCTQNIKLQLFKEDEEGSQLLKRIQFSKIQSVNESDFKVSFTLVLDPINVITVKDSKIVYKKDEIQFYTEKVKKIPNITLNETGEENQENKQADPIVEDKQQQAKQQGQQKQQNNETNKTEQQKPKKIKKKAKKVKDEYETVQRNRTVTKKYQKQLYRVDPYSLNRTDASQIKEAKRILAKYEQIEDKKVKFQQTKNKLETIIYEIRDKLENQEFLQYCQKEEIQKLGEQNQKEGKWLDDTQSNNVEDYNEHFLNLHSILQKIKKRRMQCIQRPEVKKRAIRAIEQYKNLTGKLKKQKQWITDEQIEQLEQLIQKKVQEIENMHTQMHSKKKHQDVTYRNRDMLKSAEFVKEKYFAVKATPKPKQKKKEQKKQQKKQQKQQEQEKSYTEDNQL